MTAADGEMQICGTGSECQWRPGVAAGEGEDEKFVL